MDNWRFSQDAMGNWGWQHTARDGTVAQGAQRFSSRTDCIADAMRHGYLALNEPLQRPQAAAAPVQPATAERPADSAKP